MNQFTYIMQQKFLLGKDHEHLDYTKIDNEATHAKLPSSYHNQ